VRLPRRHGDLGHGPRRPRDARAPPPETGRDTIKRWQDTTRAELRKLVTSPVRGTFAADAERYLRAVAGMKGIDERAKQIDLWISVFGNRYRERVAAAEIRERLEKWRVEKKWSASTLNHYRTALGHLWSVLDGKGERNPVRSVPRYREPDAAPRGLPCATIRAIFRAMPPSVTRLRLAIIAYTGIPHATLMRLAAASMDWRASTSVRPGRRKGRGTPEKTMPLSARARRCFRLLDRAGGWGPFSTSSMRMSFRRACRAAERAAAKKGETLDLSGVRPYDLRHSFGTAVVQATGDLQAAKEMLDHSTLSTTLRYTRASVAPAVAAAQAKVDQFVAPSRGTTATRKNAKSQQPQE
jgi:integrase